MKVKLWLETEEVKVAGWELVMGDRPLVVGGEGGGRCGKVKRLQHF